METKVCTCCGEELPSTEEYFFKDKHCRDGLLGQCKKCIRVKRLKYNGDHPEKIIASTKKYKTENKDKIKISGKKYRLENVDRENERSRKYKIDMKNDPHFKARRVLDSELRRARKLLLPATFTMEEWEETKIYFDNKCAYCDRELPSFFNPKSFKSSNNFLQLKLELLRSNKHYNSGYSKVKTLTDTSTSLRGYIDMRAGQNGLKLDEEQMKNIISGTFKSIDFEIYKSQDNKYNTNIFYL